VQTRPLTSAPALQWEIPGGGEAWLDLERTVTDLPGVYGKAILLLGADEGFTYAAAGSLPEDRIRVVRDDLRLAAGDSLTASLGPEGEDRVLLRLLRGSRFALASSWSGAVGGGANAEFRVLDPRGREVRRRRDSAFRARVPGDFVVTVRNPGPVAGSWRLDGEGLSSPPGGRSRGRWTGEGAAEVAFEAMARTGGTLTLKGPRRLELRIVSLRDPAGNEVAVTPGPEVAVPVFGSDGTWTAVVEGAAGGAGRFSLRISAVWTPGEARSR
jgi:hypothetical protein